MEMRFLAIDGFNLARRIFEARGAETDEDLADVTDAVTRSVQRAVNRHAPTHCTVVFEHHDKTWRHLLFPEYKANRSPTPPLLLKAVPTLEARFRDVGIFPCEVESYEADDVIATIATVVSQHGGHTVILSTDKVYLQLLSQGISVYDHFNERSLTAEFVEEKYGVTVTQFVDYLSLVGDRSNNIRGVSGIGPKTAVSLLKQFQRIDHMLESSPDAHKSLVKLQDDQAEMMRARQLVTLKTDVELGLNLKQFRLPPSTQN